MKPTKQTVYFETESSHMEYVQEKKGYFFTTEQLNEYTANVVRQALETAAKKAKYRGGGTYKTNEGYLESNPISIDKQSITNTFEETFKQFEV